MSDQTRDGLIPSQRGEADINELGRVEVSVEVTVGQAPSYTPHGQILTAMCRKV